VATETLNPKGMTLTELFGHFDRESHEWTEGIFTKKYRQYSLDHTNKRKWLTVDGPIDFMWVENLNSVLDDNKKLSLPNGESIKMSQGMCILLETDRMHNVTPATVSRCGLVYLHRDEIVNSK
jgi:dynein heavy chain